MKKKKKYIIFLVFLVALMVSEFGKADVCARKKTDGQETVFSGAGRGTEESPFVITNVKQLEEIHKDLSAVYILDNDIEWNSSSSWTPIGTEDEPFTGTINGNGYCIKNLNIDYTGEYPEEKGGAIRFGFLGYVRDAQIMNIGIKDAEYKVILDDYKAEEYESVFSTIGGIIGQMENSLLERSFFTGEIYHSAGSAIYVRSGSIVGLAEDESDIRNCYSNADSVTDGVNQNTMAAGGVAWLRNSKIEKSYVAGSVEGSNEHSYAYVAGINASSDESASVEYCAYILDELSDKNGNADIRAKISNFAEETGNIVLTPDSEEAYDCNTYIALGWNMDELWTTNESYPTIEIFDAER